MTKVSEKPRVTPSSPLADLGLPVRVFNILRRGGIRTVGELTALTADELHDIRNVGDSAVAEVIVTLDEHGLDITHTATVDLDYSEVAEWWTS